jgi:ATP-dependent exoDNAse (exonuclease V) beta subunit
MVVSGSASELDIAADALLLDALALDARARREALDVRRSMLLQAPAGSGKTTVLTARFLALLATADEPEEILAISFTRKAAAEMRHRLLSALQAADAGRGIRGIDSSLLQAARQRDQMRGWNLLRNPSRLRIETLDALNHWLASQLPISSGAGPDLRIASAPMSLYRRAARRCLAHALSDPEAVAVSELLFERLDNSWQRLEQLLGEMLERRSHWLPRVLDARGGGLVTRVEQSLQSVLRAELAGAMAVLPAALLREAEQILTACQPARAGCGAAGSAGLSVTLNADSASLPCWRALCELATTGSGWRQRFTIREGFAPADAGLKVRVRDWMDALRSLPGARALLAALRALPDPQLAAADRAALEALAVLLVRAAAELQLVFAESGKVDYAYVAAAARAALSEQGEPSDLALRTGGALRHVLVDEFQDTSFEQFELLRALTAGWEPGDGRSLFIVGDPMQSIYQFREAQVGLFLRARDYGVGEITVEALELRRNFRSRESLIAWVNARFGRLFPAADDARLAAIRYLPSVPAAAATAEQPDTPAVTLHRFELRQVAAEAGRVVQIVCDARARDPTASVAVLVASREHAAPIVAQLRAAGLAARGVDLEPLRARPVVRDLVALSRALLHGADRSAWLALLRAPWCGLTLAELQALLADSDGDVFARLSAALLQPGSDGEDGGAARARLQRLCDALEPSIGGSERGLPLWQRVERCWLRLAGPAVYRDPSERLDARRFLDALAVHEEPQALVGEALAQLTEGLYSDSPAQALAIQIMTIHAAKGLEWDVVILPGLGRKTRVDSDPLLHWIELPRASAGTDLLLAPIRATQQEPTASLAAYIKRLRRERSRFERVRLLYVAATRARSALHLLAALPPSQAAPAAPPTPLPGSPLELLWPVIGTELLALPVAAQTEAAGSAPDSLTPPLWRLPAHWRLPPPPPEWSARRLQFAAQPAGDVPEYSWVGLTARAVGSVVHAELHRLAAGNAIAPGAVAARDYGGWLAELGVPRAERAAANEQILRALRRTLADPRGRWLLSSEHRQARSEWRVTGLYAGRVVNVVFDRMLVDEHGERWVVDFKTSTHQGGALQDFIDAEAQRYHAQLHRYVTLAASLGPEPVRAALYFPLLGVFRELALDTGE